MSDHALQVYLAWRPMEHRLAAMAYRIENFLWGDARAQHTCLILMTEDGRILMIEIDIGDVKHGIRKSMKLMIQPLEKVPGVFSQIEWIGTIESFKAFDELLRIAEDYVTKYPRYHTLRNNCRTFIDYLVMQIPEIRDGLPKKNGSVLEYYHARAKHDHPGFWTSFKRRIKTFCYLHVLKSIMLVPNPFQIAESFQQLNQLYVLKIEPKNKEECPMSNYS